MTPLVFTWTGDVMVPHRQMQADAQYVVGERYTLDAIEERSANSHRHFFAALKDAWMNLPEEEAERFPTVEHLRKWLLIKAGWRDERSIVCRSRSEALRVAAFVRPIDEYAAVDARGATVTVMTAKSQSMRAMSKTEFSESKQAVLDLAAEMIGVAVEELSANAGQTA